MTAKQLILVMGVVTAVLLTVVVSLWYSQQAHYDRCFTDSCQQAELAEMAVRNSAEMPS